MRQYYRGSTQKHASFWVEFRELPPSERFDAFIKFFNQIKHEVEEEDCGLQEAAFSLRPIFYDEAVYAEHEADLTFVLDAVEDLIIVVRTDDKEAAEIWDYIVRFMMSLQNNR